jgi:hypothetical protein
MLCESTYFFLIFMTVNTHWPRDLRTVFPCTNTGVMGSNPTQDMGVFVRSFCVCVVLCVGRGLATG